MFRSMIRIKQQLSMAESESILALGKTAVLAVLGDDGYPYTVPVNYVYTGGKIYIHCAGEGHKLDAIAACDKVSLCVVAKDEVCPEELTTLFVVVFGRARVLQSREETARAVEALGLKYNPDAELVRREVKAWPNVCCIEITPEHITGKECIELTKARAAK